MQTQMPPLDAPDNWSTAERRLAADRRLDMELEQTFPASDPITRLHEIGRRRSSASMQSTASDGGEK